MSMTEALKASAIFIPTIILLVIGVAITLSARPDSSARARGVRLVLHNLSRTVAMVGMSLVTIFILERLAGHR